MMISKRILSLRDNDKKIYPFTVNRHKPGPAVMSTSWLTLLCRRPCKGVYGWVLWCRISWRKIIKVPWISCGTIMAFILFFMALHHGKSSQLENANKCRRQHDLILCGKCSSVSGFQRNANIYMILIARRGVFIFAVIVCTVFSGIIAQQLMWFCLMWSKLSRACLTTVH